MSTTTKEQFDAAESEAKAAARRRKLAAIEPHRVRKGEVKNPQGKNGVLFSKAMRNALYAPGKLKELCEAAVDNAIGGDVNWAEFVGKYVGMKQPTEPSKLEIAEHLRKIDADRTRLAITILGDRLKTMDGKAVGEFLRACSVDADVFLRAAAALQEAGDVPAQLEAGLEEDRSHEQDVVATLDGDSLVDGRGGNNASPKDRDAADHAPSRSIETEPVGGGGAYEGKEGQEDGTENK